MRHLKSKRKLGRSNSHRRAMFSNMAASLIQEERITTTEARAKELRGIVERLITLAKRAEAAKNKPEATETDISAANVHYRRLAYRKLKDYSIVKKLFDEITPRFLSLPDGRPWKGGYTRILKIGRRHGDNAPLSLIEFVGANIKPKKIKRQKPVEEEAE